MQPYFLPYLGYFSLIASTDRWIVFDTAQYDRKGWMNRNRILKRNGGWKFIRVPTVKAPQNTPISEIKIRSKEDALAEILRNLDAYRDIGAPFFEMVRELLVVGFEGESESLVNLNVNLLAVICSYLDVEFNYDIYSKLDIEVPPAEHPGQWAPKIAAAVGAQCYLNPIGGRAIFRPEEFAASGVDLAFLHPPASSYLQRIGHDFIDRLSVIDALMFLSPDQVRAILNTCTVERSTRKGRVCE